MLHIVDLASNNFIGTIPGTLLQSCIAMMDDGNDTRGNMGYLFFDMYDFHHSVRYKDVLPLINKVIVRKLMKLYEVESRSAFDDMYAFF